MSARPGDHDGCDACPIDRSRRSFLRDAGMGLAALAGLGSLAEAAGLPIRHMAALARRDMLVDYPLPAEDGVQIDKVEEVILVRWQGAIYAFNLSCPHQRTALKWLPDDGRFQCPKHKSKYTPQGTFMSGRATRGMDRFPVTIHNNTVTVDTSLMHKQDKDPAGWSAAMARIS